VKKNFILLMKGRLCISSAHILCISVVVVDVFVVTLKDGTAMHSEMNLRVLLHFSVVQFALDKWLHVFLLV
jgi:hypothetical protein